MESAPCATQGGLLLSFLGTKGWAMHRRLSGCFMESHGMKHGLLPCSTACMSWDVVVSFRLMHRSPGGWSPKIKLSGRSMGGGVHEPYAELFLQSMYLYELLSSSPNSAQDGPVSCSAPNISVSVVAVRTTGFSYLSLFCPGKRNRVHG